MQNPKLFKYYLRAGESFPPRKLKYKLEEFNKVNEYI
jgi:hypothetical protein